MHLKSDREKFNQIFQSRTAITCNSISLYSRSNRGISEWRNSSLSWDWFKTNRRSGEHSTRISSPVDPGATFVDIPNRSYGSSQER